MEKLKRYAGTVLEAEIESYKRTVTELTHDYYSEMDRADRNAEMASCFAGELEDESATLKSLISRLGKLFAEWEREKESLANSDSSSDREVSQTYRECAEAILRAMNSQPRQPKTEGENRQ